jgi:hypothetical protein
LFYPWNQLLGIYNSDNIIYSTNQPSESSRTTSLRIKIFDGAALAPMPVTRTPSEALHSGFSFSVSYSSFLDLSLLANQAKARNALRRAVGDFVGPKLKKQATTNEERGSHLRLD